MSLFSRLLAPWWGGAAPSPRAAVQSDGPGVLISDSRELEEYLRSGHTTSSGETVTVERAMTQSAVYGCVRIISGAVSTMPLAIKRRVDDRTREDANDHPVALLLRRRPNAWMTPSAFRRMLTAHVLLRGNAYALKVRGFDGRITALWPLHPDRVETTQRPDMSIVHKYTRPDGAVIEYGQNEIFHLIGMSFDGIKGVSVIRYAAETLGLSLATQKHGATVFKNGTNVGGVLTSPIQLGREGLEFLQASLEKFRGASNAHKTLVLEQSADYKPLGMNLEDAQLVEILKLTRGDLTMFFGVPPHMLGDTEKSTSWGSGIQEQGIGFVAYTLQDWLTAWEETIVRDLIADEPDIYAKFNTAGLVRGDIKARYDAYAAGRRMKVLSANDVRELEDMNPYEGGDVYENPEITVPKPAPASAETAV